MIVWLASFPRSGNTFLRILLHRLHGVRSSTVYEADGVAERLGRELIGSEERPADYAAMRASPGVHFIKTHRQRDRHIDDADRAICLVRDGRDCLVSWARLATEDDPSEFELRLRDMIAEDAASGTGSWGANVLSWLRPVAVNRAVLRYEALVAEPVASVAAAMGQLGLDLPMLDAAAPDFTELCGADATFFRRGGGGAHRDEMPKALHELFWSRPENAAAMALLGYDREAGTEPRLR